MAFALSERGRSTALAVSLAVTLALVAASSLAEPMAKDACDGVKAEQDGLVAGGVRDDMAKGADWAKANLGHDRLQRIQRYIELDEQLLFRCGHAKVRFVPPPEEEAPAEPPKPAEKPKAKPKPKPEAKAKPDAKGPAAEPAKAQAAPSEKAGAVVAPVKPKPKNKTDDAYRPPVTGDPTGDPFKNQAGPPKQ